MKINEFMKVSTRYKDLEHYGRVFEQMEVALLPVLKNCPYVYGVKCPRTFVEWAVSRRDSGDDDIDSKLTIGYTCNKKRIVAGYVITDMLPNNPGYHDQSICKITWDDPWNNDLMFVAQDTWIIIGMDKPANESQWLTGEDFAGLTFVELER